MSATSLLEDLRTRGVQLTADGPDLCFRAPKGVLTPALRAALAEHKAALLIEVKAEANGWRRVPGGWTETPARAAASVFHPNRALAEGDLLFCGGCRARMLGEDGDRA